MFKRIVLAAGIILLLFTFWYYSQHPLATKVTINRHVLYVDVAATPSSREKGLSGRITLAQNAGMLFVFQASGLHGFWMRGMNFPLDFIWINNKRVVDLTPNVPPVSQGGSPSVIEPSEPVNMVLEVNAGTIERLGINVGDSVEVN